MSKHKTGLEFFSLDTDLLSDDKISFLIAEHKLEGLGVYIALLTRIYRDGYFLEASERSLKTFAFRIALDYETLRKMMDTFLAEDLFNAELFKQFNILTSSGIQKRFLHGCNRRKSVRMFEEYLLFDVNKYCKDEGLRVEVAIENVVEVKSETKETKQKKEPEKLHPLQIWVNENTPRVGRMKKPLTFTECENLLKSNSEAVIKETLKAMENYAKLNNYLSTNLTLNNWLKRDGRTNNLQGNNRPATTITDKWDNYKAV